MYKLKNYATPSIAYTPIAESADIILTSPGTTTPPDGQDWELPGMPASL